MSTKNLITCLVILSCFNAWSQTTDDSKKLTKDLGFNTNIVFNSILNSTQAPVSLLFKTYSSDDTAWRFGTTLGFLVSSPASGTSSASTFTFARNYNISLVIGKEFQEKLTEHWVWYYGADIVPGYVSNTTDTYLPFNQKTRTTTTTSATFAARPFLGARFNIGQRLYLSTEFSASLTYRRDTIFDKNVLANQVNADTNSSTFSLAFAPATSLFLFYRF